MDDDKKSKLDVLLKENQNIRVELTAMIKNIQYCFFSFLASVGIFVGIITNISLQHAPFYQQDFDTGLVAFLISQIEVIIVIFSIYIQTDIFYKAAYISYIERKINFLLGEEIIFWESRICKDMWSASILGKHKHQNTAILTQRIQAIFYFMAFVSLIVFTFSKLENLALLMLQSVEVCICAFLLYSLGKAHANAASYINTIQPDNKMDIMGE